MAEGGRGDDRLLLGEIGAAHGLKGEVRLRSYTDAPEAIAAYPLEDEAGRALTIAALRAGPKGLIAKVKGVGSREAAEALTGTKLYVARENLPEAEEDEFYYADLIGLAAIDRETGARLGTVTALHNFGAGDILELAPAGGGPTLLIPFSEATVPEVKIAEGILVLVPPEELALPPGEASSLPEDEAQSGGAAPEVED